MPKKLKAGKKIVKYLDLCIDMDFDEEKQENVVKYTWEEGEEEK